jgi:hypothetical protein
MPGKWPLRGLNVKQLRRGTELAGNVSQCLPMRSVGNVYTMHLALAQTGIYVF